MTEYGICAKCRKSVGCSYADDRIKGCKNFVLEDELELTNEELLRQCTTEQLAEHLLNVWMDGAFNVNAEFGLNEAQIEQHKGDIVEWLKQPHTTKE